MYTNPVAARDFPDPAVRWHAGAYYAFGTTGAARTADGRAFRVLRSTNLTDWQEVGGALVPPPGTEDAQFWAPKPAYHAGLFYLYYSRGGGAVAATQGHRGHG